MSGPAPHILIIDDEEGIRFSLRGILEDEGMQVSEAASGEEGLTLAESARPDLVFLDVWLPGMNGIEVLEKLRALADTPVIMISGHATVETAVKALRLGAHDFIEKPLSLEKVLLTVQHSLEMAALRRENTALRAVVDSAEDSGIVGVSPPMLAFRQALDKVAPTDAWVLITGENGTGKELAARAIHKASRRSGAPLVAVNSAAIPEELIESELFGHEKGAFTGAEAPRAGKFELAHKGTIFLDEIGDMSLKTQAKILRILQEQCFERVGGSRTLRVDTRVIAATNKNLEEAIQRGTFREDLYYRLRVFPLHVPPLRERKGDLPLLLAALSAKVEKRMGMRPPAFDPEALEVLEAWHWPGNVRELGNLIERMTILAPGGCIRPSDLPPEMARPAAGQGKNQLLRNWLEKDFKSARAAFESYYLNERLNEAGGNITRLAEMAGLERSYLHRKLKASACYLSEDE